jgi:uncharacterized protein (TIGR00369 family)
MDWLEFVRSRIGSIPMPMGDLFGFELLDAEPGKIRARALPHARHYNPFGVAQGGFAGSVLDIALGLVSISVLPPEAKGVATGDLSVRYVRPIYDSTGWMNAEAIVLHAGRTLVVAEARLFDADGKLYAVAQSNSVIVS